MKNQRTVLARFTPLTTRRLGLMGVLCCLTTLLACDDTAETDEPDTDSGIEACGPLANLPTAEGTVIVLNELLSKNDSVNSDEGEDFDDWIELYNPTAEDVDVSGWRLGDGLSTCVEPWPFPEGTVISANGHLLVWADKDPEQGALHADFKLSAGAGETVSLINADGQLADEVEMPSMEADVSWARPSDGGTGWTTSNSPTPGASN